jgi:hypothetical protein
MARAGSRIAPTALVDAAHAAGTPIKAGEPLAGLLGLGSPFGDPLVTLGHGKPSQAIAGAFDAAKEGIKYAPGVRTLPPVVRHQRGPLGRPDRPGGLGGGGQAGEGVGGGGDRAMGV